MLLTHHHLFADCIRMETLLLQHFKNYSSSALNTCLSLFQHWYVHVAKIAGKQRRRWEEKYNIKTEKAISQARKSVSCFLDLIYIAFASSFPCLLYFLLPVSLLGNETIFFSNPNYLTHSHLFGLVQLDWILSFLYRHIRVMLHCMEVLPID